jgi:hypothetical protein
MCQNNYIFVNKSDTIRELPCICTSTIEQNICLEVRSLFGKFSKMFVLGWCRKNLYSVYLVRVLSIDRIENRDRTIVSSVARAPSLVVFSGRKIWRQLFGFGSKRRLGEVFNLRNPLKNEEKQKKICW